MISVVYIAAFTYFVFINIVMGVLASISNKVNGRGFKLTSEDVSFNFYCSVILTVVCSIVVYMGTS